MELGLGKSIQNGVPRGVGLRDIFSVIVFFKSEGLSPIAPPEPPDNVNILSPLRILNNSAKPSPRDFIQTLVLMLACPTMETKLRGGGDPLVLW